MKAHASKPRPKTIVCGSGTHKTPTGDCACDLHVQGIYDEKESFELDPRDVRMWFSIDPTDPNKAVSNCGPDLIALSESLASLDAEGKRLGGIVNGVIAGNKANAEEIAAAYKYADDNFATKEQVRVLGARQARNEEKTRNLEANRLDGSLGAATVFGSYAGVGQGFLLLDGCIAGRIKALGLVGFMACGGPGGGGTGAGGVVRIQGMAAVTVNVTNGVAILAGAQAGQSFLTSDKKFGTNMAGGDVDGLLGLGLGSQGLGVRIAGHLGYARALTEIPGPPLPNGAVAHEVRTGLGGGIGLAVLGRTNLF